MLGKLIEQHNEQMTLLVGRIGYEHDLFEQRGKIKAKLMKMTHLSVRDRIKVVKLIVREKKNIDLFFSYVDEEKVEFVDMLIHANIP